VNRRVLVILLVIPAIASLMGCNTANRQPLTKSSRNAVQPIEGEYLSTEYIEELRRSRSPLKAGSTIDELKLVLVERHGKQFQLMPIINFHEGDSGFVLDLDGSIAPSPEPRATPVSNVSATVLDDHTIRFGYSNFKPATYVCVKEAAAYVSKAVLVGRYQDEQGRKYEFQEDGWAVFPDRRFEYEIGLDHVLEHFDYFMDAGHDRKHLPWRVWGFKWKRNTLEVFRTKEEDGIDEIDDSHPFLLLHPVR
jgi:hypothetical protein